jgi:hypothetical protein
MYGLLIWMYVGTNLLGSIQAPHLRDDDVIDIVFSSQCNHISNLLVDQGLISRQRIRFVAIPVSAEAVECVSAFSGSSEKFGIPLGALIDARLVLPGLVADTARAGLFAVAGARGADLGSNGFSQSVDFTLGLMCQCMGRWKMLWGRYVPSWPRLLEVSSTTVLF